MLLEGVNQGSRRGNGKVVLYTSCSDTKIWSQYWTRSSSGNSVLESSAFNAMPLKKNGIVLTVSNAWNGAQRKWRVCGGLIWNQLEHSAVTTLWGIKNCTLLTCTITMQNYAILWWFLAHRCTWEYPIACLFDSLCKIENWEPAYQIFCCLLSSRQQRKMWNTVATRGRRLHHSRPMVS